MGKLDEIMRLRGGNIAESIGQGGGGPVTIPRREVPRQQQGVRRSDDAMEIEVDRITPDPDQPRKEFDPGAIERMADSLRARGQIQPIMVRWCPADERWVIVSGERRWRGAMLAGLKSMKAVVRKESSDRGELLVDQLAENLVREDLSPLEQARGFRDLMRLKGWSGNQLSKELGIAQPRVVQALALLELPESVRERVQLEELPASTAYEVSKIADPTLQEELARKVVDRGLTRAETRLEVERATARGAATRRPAGKGRGGKSRIRKVTERVIRTAAGTKITIENRRGLDVATILAALDEAKDRVKMEAGDDHVAA
jgi:ParB family chromosome partitioning protein